MCCTPKKQTQTSNRLPNINQVQETDGEVDDADTVNYINKFNHLYNQVFDSSYKSSDDDDYITLITSEKGTKAELLNVYLTYANTKITAIWTLEVTAA